MIEALRLVFIASLFGGMIFFASGVAPTVFKALSKDDARVFLRTIFPSYYLFIILTAGAAALLSFQHVWDAVGLGFVAFSTLIVRQIAVPQINRWRDAGEAGDEPAAKRFAAGHRFTVVLNLVQLLIVGGILWNSAA
ncbi:MAG: DUF4149 domain-containing protein [Parvularcula sp.]|jgi:hypothetical protein|nr:DUF4149 domain-containing protein [Parvularcula sp.]